jgi:acyl carrier protein
MLDLIAFLEQTFAVKVADHDVVGQNFETVRSVVEFVRRKLAPSLEV